MARGGIRRTIVAAIVLPLAGKAMQRAAQEMRVRNPNNKISDPLESAARLFRRL